ncbi:uncharacterized protein ACRADG_002273 isoform 4-T4 [Cochliomyia hominivorax]
MDESSKKILIEKDYSHQIIPTRRSFKNPEIYLQDLNYDCLRKIFQHLDLAAQFSLLKSSKNFVNIILYDIWYPYYEDLIDISQDQSMQKQSKDFQMEFLHLVLKTFSRIKGIPLEIFIKFLNKTSIKDFSQITSLSIQNSKTNDSSNILHLKDLNKFPQLQELEFDHIYLTFTSSINNFITLKSLQLNNVKVLNDYKGEFLKIMLSPNLEKLSLKSFNRDNISFQNFSQISQCLQLKELNLSLHYLHDPRILDDIFNLRTLQILTLDSQDNFYFTSKDHTIFYAILKIFSQNPFKSINGLQINGMPEKIFYLCPYLQDIKNLNWCVTKIFHRKLDGSVEWKSDIPEIINSFYDFLVDTKELEKVFVKDNIFHKKRVLKEINFMEKLQDLRKLKGFGRLNIISNYNDIENPEQLFNNQCPRGKRNYKSSGRPFTKYDINPTNFEINNESVDVSCGWEGTDFTTQKCSGEGRPFNPSLDLTENRLSNVQYACPTQYSAEGRAFNPVLDLSRQRYQNNKNRRGCPLNLEYEMARNKEIALGRLRAEQATAKAAYPRPPLNYEKPTAKCYREQKMPTSKGREFDMRAEIQRHQTAEMANVCGRPARDNIKEGRKLDVDRIYDFNKHACSPTGRTGRPLDLQRDLTFRRKNLPTPKQHRASSCPTPVQYSTLHSPIQRVPRICPRPQSVSSSPIRSVSPSISPVQQILNKSTDPATSVNQTTATPVCPLGESSLNTPISITKTIRTTTTTTGPSSDLSYFKKPTDSFLEPFSDQISRPKNFSNITQDNSCYRQTSPQSFNFQNFSKTPRTPLYEPSIQKSFQKSYDTIDPYATEESIQQERSMANKNISILNKTQTIPSPPPLPPPDPNMIHCTYNIEEDYLPLPSRICPSPVKTQTPNKSQTPTSESYYHNMSLFNEPNSYGKLQTEPADNCYVDLTNQTQYQCDMDISAPDLTPRSAYPQRQVDNRLMQSGRIPPEDITCQESYRYNTYSDQPNNFTSTYLVPNTKNITQCQELLSALKPQEVSQPLSTTCSPCDKPKSSLFRCLAEKLSSTYDFISSFVTPEKSTATLTLPTEQTLEQVFDSSMLYKGCPQESALYNLRNLCTAQCPNVTTLGHSTFHGDKTQLRPETPSTKECANAKRCGRVQFDSSDKSQVQDTQRSALRKVEIENLVKDAYCPGIIQDTIDGRENFNDFSFNITLNQDTRDVNLCERPPLDDPMTLLEAFSMRIEKERLALIKDLHEEATKEQIEDSIQEYFAKQNPSDLNRSIKSFLLAEHLQDHEQVVESKGTSLEAEVQKLITTFPDNAKVKLTCYTGHTKSKNDETS